MNNAQQQPLLNNSHIEQSQKHMMDPNGQHGTGAGTYIKYYGQNNGDMALLGM